LQGEEVERRREEEEEKWRSDRGQYLAVSDIWHGSKDHQNYDE